MEVRQRKTSNSLESNKTSEVIDSDNKNTKSKEETKKTTTKVDLDHNASFINRLSHWLWLQEDASFLGVFRIFWGLIMTWEIWLYITFDFNKTIHHFYSSRYGFLPKYYYFEFVDIIPFAQMKIVLVIILTSAICVTLGLKYRISCIVFFFGISYLFLLNSLFYLNHIYLVAVISFIMIFIPCNCVYALDSRKVNKNGKIPTVPK